MGAFFAETSPPIARAERSGRLLGDETHFLKTLFESPRLTGAVAPSGRFLARAMARAVDPPRRRASSSSSAREPGR